MGDRAPGADLVTADGVRLRLFDAYRGPHFTAIAYGDYAADELAELNWPAEGVRLKRLHVEVAAAHTQGADHVLSDPTGDFARIYGLSRSAVLLIRPDGYIGHIATHDIAETTGRAVQVVTPRKHV